jgi:5-methylcytosine-specific restriction protein A
MGRWGHLYGKRWRKRARYQLQIEPLCRMCKSEGRITAASVADHVIPHRGDINSFWLGELQSLCTFHHNSTKKIFYLIHAIRLTTTQGKSGGAK